MAILSDPVPDRYVMLVLHGTGSKTEKGFKTGPKKENGAFNALPESDKIGRKSGKIGPK